MKILFTLTSLTLLFFSSTSSADWWQGWENTNSRQANYSSEGQTKGSTNTNVESQSKMLSWTTGKAKTDGEIDFSVNFKGSGTTNVNANNNLSSNTQAHGVTTGNWSSYGNTSANTNSYGLNRNNNYASNMPWNAQANRVNPRANWSQRKRPTLAPPQAPNFQQMQAQMEIQRKQYEAYAKQMAAQQKAAAEAFKLQQQFNR